ncbi:MAG TPA: hypothetical protein VFM12_00410, partial [Gemmatimonadales bacterium]|nr:hypothetical protein [Gemmatimonadales bacterium]
MSRMTALPLLAGLLAGWSGSAWAETIYVSNEKGNSITIIDGASLEVVKEVPVGQRPRGITL